ncbi:hypothetical protein ACFQ0M_09660 [Kitasatospora aburaviensis]
MTDAPDVTDAADATEFLDLTRLLTAEPAPDPAVGDAYRQRLTRAFPGDLPRLLDAHRKAATQPDPAAALQSALDGDPGLARAAGRRSRSGSPRSSPVPTGPSIRPAAPSSTSPA